MQVPFIDLNAQFADLESELMPAIRGVLEQTNFILGQPVADFEQAFAAYCECDHAVGVASGLDGIKLALRALDIGPGDEVITAANTFIATVLGISAAGATPVLVDIDEATYNLDPSLVADAITPRTKAIMPVHLYGQPAEMDPLLEMARTHGLAIIEDASQAHGARYRGRRVGSFGAVSAFSLYPGKNLGAYGDGGVITTRRSDIAEKLSVLRNYGSKVKYYHLVKGENSRLDTLHAAVCGVKLRHLDEANQRRREVAARYTERLQNLDAVTVPTILPHVEHVFHLYVIRVAKRDELMQFLKEKGVASIIHYPIPIHRQEAYQDGGWTEGQFPITETCAGEILSLPMFPELTHDQIDYVTDCIREYYT